MAGDATDAGGFAEAVCFLGYFSGLPDPRQRGKVLHPLDEVLLLSLLAVLAGAETFADIARFGDRKLAFCGGSGRSGMARRRMITWAISSPALMRRSSSVASSPGLARCWAPRRR